MAMFRVRVRVTVIFSVRPRARFWVRVKLRIMDMVLLH
jgi:hypothetical protein